MQPSARIVSVPTLARTGASAGTEKRCITLLRARMQRSARERSERW
jgi:hypothetical protein